MPTSRTYQYDTRIAPRLGIRTQQAAAAIELIDAGNTIPFIARYRKELTDRLDEEQLRQLHELLDSLRRVDERRETVLNSIQEQEKLTPELEQQLLAAETLTEIEDLYAPYKPKRRTRASLAREKGLEGLAALIIQQVRQPAFLNEIVAPYVDGDTVTDADDALSGARDIVAEDISNDAAVRQAVRERVMRHAEIQSERLQDADDEKGVYEVYYDFAMRLGRLKPYQVLALNRGESEKVLRVRLSIEERTWREPISRHYRPDSRSPLAEQLDTAIDDCAKRLLLPAIERDIRNSLSESAEAHAITVFATNLRGLLSQAPLAERIVLGIDPAYRTGCKLAVIDTTGKVLHTDTIYPHKPQAHYAKAKATLEGLIQRYSVTLIAIGNGTASRETEALVAELTRQRDDVHYLMVNEAGASVYSASPLARQELPDLDVSLRGAVSIARRVQDPLAELVKIDPKAIGVGMYQHDVNQKQLAAALDSVVESVVNQVGVDLNTASVALLTYVAGIGPKVAQNIIAYREEIGAFESRAQLKKVPKLGPKAFEQAAGFLRVRGGGNPLDASAIHPESYAAARALLKQAAIDAKADLSQRQAALDALLSTTSPASLAQALGVGLPTLEDILAQLKQPGRDPRADTPPPLLRNDVLQMEHLQVGMQLHGTVRNVVDFGAFIDIGVKQDGLLHHSQIPQGLVLGVGEVLEVEILAVEIERGRISLGWPTPTLT